eukprot:TRINITY_DN24958_c0_g1_i1.p1 TRINITY_DN24958_c0_g1~~TRINITY_DN24958_c0_g1_i1.p1  ORF type:complete len:446 (+),score=34.97 TRINITY_DN24958_c0_g1_i1:227-1564(+)
MTPCGNFTVNDVVMFMGRCGIVTGERPHPLWLVVQIMDDKAKSQVAHVCEARPARRADCGVLALGKGFSGAFWGRARQPRKPPAGALQRAISEPRCVLDDCSSHKEMQAAVGVASVASGGGQVRMDVKRHLARCTASFVPGAVKHVASSIASDALRTWQFVNDAHAWGPLDCHGTGCEETTLPCHDECECRHLDHIERQRFWGSAGGWCWPRQGLLTIIAGIQRSGSTWLFNAVRLLYRQARVACDSYWLRILTEGKLERRLQTGAHVVVKTHDHWNWYDELIAKRASAVLLAHRDLRGIQASMHRLGWISPRGDVPPVFIANHMSWHDLATLDIAYEDMVRDDVAQLRIVATHIGLNRLGDEDLRQVSAELKVLRAPPRGINQTTKVLHGHRGRSAGNATTSHDASNRGDRKATRSRGHDLGSSSDPVYRKWAAAYSAAYGYGT